MVSKYRREVFVTGESIWNKACSCVSALFPGGFGKAGPQKLTPHAHREADKVELERAQAAEAGAHSAQVHVSQVHHAEGEAGQPVTCRRLGKHVRPLWRKKKLE